MDSLLLDREIKDKGNKDMYSKSFDGKRNRATAEGLLIGAAVGCDAVGFDIGDGGIDCLSGVSPFGQLACGSCRPAGKCALYGAVLCEKGQL